MTDSLSLLPPSLSPSHDQLLPSCDTIFITSFEVVISNSNNSDIQLQLAPTTSSSSSSSTSSFSSANHSTLLTDLQYSTPYQFRVRSVGGSPSNGSSAGSSTCGVPYTAGRFSQPLLLTLPPPGSMFSLHVCMGVSLPGKT